MRPASVAAVALMILALADQGGVAQSLSNAPTDAPNGAAIDTPDDALRGTVVQSPEATQPQEPVEPEQSQAAPLAPVGRLRPLPAGQGSALLEVRVGAPRLPQLQPYPTSQRPLRGVTVDTIDPATIGPTVAALPVPPAVRRRPVETDPYAPIGFSLGALRLTPYYEQSVGFDSNPDQVSTGVKPSAFAREEGGLSLLSLWSSNELKANLRAGYSEFFSDAAANRPDANGTVDYRYDVTRDITLDGEGRFAISTQRPGSPELNVAVEGRPLVSSYGTTIGVNDTLGRLTLGLHGLFDRTQYENGTLTDGTTVALDAQNFNDYGLALRADYQLTPTLKPFAEVTLDTRVHDDKFDLSGYQRDSDGVVGRLGTTFELTPLITGTVSAGYEDRSYTDKRLKDLRGPVVDATVVYAITPLTTLTLLASTSFDETNLAGSSGAESRSVSLSVSHALFRNLTLTGTLAYLNTNYLGSPIVENTYSGTLKASYAISRSIVLEATYNHQTLKSTDPTSGFDQDVVLVGVRVQH